LREWKKKQTSDLVTDGPKLQTPPEQALALGAHPRLGSFVVFCATRVAMPPVRGPSLGQAPARPDQGPDCPSRRPPIPPPPPQYVNTCHQYFTGESPCRSQAVRPSRPPGPDAGGTKRNVPARPSHAPKPAPPAFAKGPPSTSARHFALPEPDLERALLARPLPEKSHRAKPGLTSAGPRVSPPGAPTPCALGLKLVECCNSPSPSPPRTV